MEIRGYFSLPCVLRTGFSNAFFHQLSFLRTAFVKVQFQLSDFPPCNVCQTNVTCTSHLAQTVAIFIIKWGVFLWEPIFFNELLALFFCVVSTVMSALILYLCWQSLPRPSVLWFCVGLSKFREARAGRYLGSVPCLLMFLKNLQHFSTYFSCLVQSRKYF